MLPQMPESKVTSDGGSEATRAQEIDMRDKSEPKVASDQHLGLPIAQNYQTRSPWTLKFGTDSAGS